MRQPEGPRAELRGSAPARARRADDRKLACVVAGLAALAAAIACGDGSHVFEGRLFHADRGCLATTSSVDVVEGDRPGDCGPVCLTQPLVDGGRAVYVATMCPPFPFGFDAGGADPACAVALAALERNDTCLRDSGSRNPPPPLLDAGAGPDGGS